MKGFLSLELLNRLQSTVDSLSPIQQNSLNGKLLLDIYEDVKPGPALSPVTEMGILSFAEAQWGVKSLDSVLLKACAELGEAADEVIKTGEGRSELVKADMEIGDVLVVLSQYAAKRGTTLDSLRAGAYAKCKQRVEDAQDELPLEDPVADITLDDTIDSLQGPVYPNGVPKPPVRSDFCSKCLEWWTDCTCVKHHKPASAL